MPRCERTRNVAATRCRPENIDIQDSCYRLDAVNVRRTARGCASNVKSTPDIFAPGASTTVCTAGDAGVHRAGTLEESMWTRYSPAGSAVNSNSPSASVTVILYPSSKMTIRLAPGTGIDGGASDASVAPPDGSNTRTRPRSLPNRTRGKDVTAVPRFATSISIVRREPMSHQAGTECSSRATVWTPTGTFLHTKRPSASTGIVRSPSSVTVTCETPCSPGSAKPLRFTSSKTTPSTIPKSTARFVPAGPVADLRASSAALCHLNVFCTRMEISYPLRSRCERYSWNWARLSGPSVTESY